MAELTLKNIQKVIREELKKELKTALSTALKPTEERLEKVETRLSDLEERVEEINRQVFLNGKEIKRLIENATDMNVRFSYFESRLDRIDGSLDRLGESFHVVFRETFSKIS